MRPLFRKQGVPDRAVIDTTWIREISYMYVTYVLGMHGYTELIEMAFIWDLLGIDKPITKSP